jgi:geranylgeranyl pyrophosphate synthase
MTLAPLFDPAPSRFSHLIDGEVAAFPTALAAHVWEAALWAPVREILERPGKSFRARLAEVCFRLVDRRREPPPDLGVALEILHAGSLVVDDIEDGSLDRRGGRTLHRIFGVPRALNAGNFMYFWALDRLARLPIGDAAAGRIGRRALRTMLDCHRGQALDVSLVVGRTPQSEVPAAVEETTRLKTGSLVALAAYAGVTAADGDGMERDAATAFGLNFGRALQKLDDLGNLSDRRAPSKRFEDIYGGRLTWPWAWAAEGLAPARYGRLAAEARAVGRERPAPANEARVAALAAELRDLAGADRRARIVADMQGALAELEHAFGQSEVTRALATEILRLGTSYG